jgi:hypothetical protein
LKSGTSFWLALYNITKQSGVLALFYSYFGCNQFEYQGVYKLSWLRGAKVFFSCDTHRWNIPTKQATTTSFQVLTQSPFVMILPSNLMPYISAVGRVSLNNI